MKVCSEPYDFINTCSVKKEWFETFSSLVTWKTMSRFWAISNKSQAFDKPFWVMTFKLVKYWHEKLIIDRWCIHGCFRISNSWSWDRQLYWWYFLRWIKTKSRSETKESKKKHRVKYINSPVNLNCLNCLVVLGGRTTAQMSTSMSTQILAISQTNTVTNQQKNMKAMQRKSAAMIYLQKERGLTEENSFRNHWKSLKWTLYFGKNGWWAHQDINPL